MRRTHPCARRRQECRFDKLAINNEIDRFSLAIDAIDRTPRLQRIGAHAKERFRNMQIECRNYAYEHGVDSPEINGVEMAVLSARVGHP
jgi:phosphoketolase